MGTERTILREAKVSEREHAVLGASYSPQEETGFWPECPPLLVESPHCLRVHRVSCDLRDHITAHFPLSAFLHQRCVTDSLAGRPRDVCLDSWRIRNV